MNKMTQMTHIIRSCQRQYSCCRSGYHKANNRQYHLCSVQPQALPFTWLVSKFLITQWRCHRLSTPLGKDIGFIFRTVGDIDRHDSGDGSLEINQYPWDIGTQGLYVPSLEMIRTRYQEIILDESLYVSHYSNKYHKGETFETILHDHTYINNNCADVVVILTSKYLKLSAKYLQHSSALKDRKSPNPNFWLSFKINCSFPKDAFKDDSRR